MDLPAWLLAPLFRPGERPPRSPVGSAPQSVPAEQVPRPFISSPIGTAARAPRPRSARRSALLTGLLALVCSLSLSAAEPADSFAGLKIFDVPGSLPAVLHYDPALTQIINKPISTDEDPAFITRVFRAKLDRTQEEWYFVDFDSGPSDDPSFTLTREGASEPAASIPGLHLYLPGNGALYASGHADTMFDEHRKYVLKGGKITETKQPFLAVGLEGKAKKDLTIYTTTAQKEAVAFIPKGAAMTLLVADGQDNYLVKTAFGLVGWVKIPPYSQDATLIEGLYYAGD